MTHRKLSLARLQQAFLRSLLAAPATRVPPFINAKTRREATARLTPYQTSIAARRHQTLFDLYPVCQQLVGPAFFSVLTQAYSVLHLSRAPDLNEFGAEFAKFIDSYAPAAELPYLGDLARLEWAWHCLANAPDPEPFDIAKFTTAIQQSDNAISLHLAATTTLLQSPYPVHKIWFSHQSDYRGPQQITLASGRDYRLVIWRSPQGPRQHQLTKVEWLILSLCQQALPLDLICLQPEVSEALMQDSTLVAHCIQQGWLEHFSLAFL